MLLLGEAPERLDHHARFHPDKESAGAIVISSHLLGLAITLARIEPRRARGPEEAEHSEREEAKRDERGKTRSETLA
jgi:hypothetical protein